MDLRLINSSQTKFIESRTATAAVVRKGGVREAVHLKGNSYYEIAC